MSITIYFIIIKTNFFRSYKHLLSSFFDSLRKKYIKLCFSRNFKNKERKTITNETTDPLSINSPKLSEQTPIK